MRKQIILITILTLMLFLVSCGSGIPAEKACTEDSQCVAATCCHSTESVNEDYAPNCQGVFCSSGCEEGTLDCGFAKSRCVEGACSVVAVE